MPMPSTNAAFQTAPLADPFIERARNRPTDPAPTRIIEIGEIAAGIAVPELGGVRFFSSDRDFDSLDGTVFRSTEQAVRAARALTRLPKRSGAGGRHLRLV